jgi:hypothetical protein
MRAIDAHNRLPEVATDQFLMDRALKQMRKLRWIGQEIDAKTVLAVLNESTQSSSRFFKQATPQPL